MEYFDKYGVEITAGSTIKIADNEPELVYACGDDDLGVNASNEAYLRNHPEAEREFYPLSEFCREYLELVQY